MKAKKKSKEPVKAGNILKQTWSDKKPVLLFVGLFALIIVLFYIIWVSPFFVRHVFEPIISFYATTAGKVLTLFGYSNSVIGTAMYGTGVQLSIKRGCDAIEATALFVAAIVAFPVNFRRKIAGLLFGILTLALVNLFRIVTLFIAALKYPSLFNFLHDELWQVIYIGIAVLLLIVWLQWVRRAKEEKYAS